MTWLSPLRLTLVPTSDSDSFKIFAPNVTGIPLAPHCGSFGIRRKKHMHQGIDLYAPEDSTVFAVEDGIVTKVGHFTGQFCEPATPFWNNTMGVYVEGASGAVMYGELYPAVKEGDYVKAGDKIGHIKHVLLKDKGRPRSMLHLELHVAGTTEFLDWQLDQPMPESLRDPTPYLLKIVQGFNQRRSSSLMSTGY